MEYLHHASFGIGVLGVLLLVRSRGANPFFLRLFRLMDDQ
jgi:hypothetical protein